MSLPWVHLGERPRSWVLQRKIEDQKSRFPVRGVPLTPYKCGTAQGGVMFVDWPCCCRDALWPILVLPDAPCCELSPQKIKCWVWVNTGIILDQIPGF